MTTKYLKVPSRNFCLPLIHGGAFTRQRPTAAGRDFTFHCPVSMHAVLDVKACVNTTKDSKQDSSLATLRMYRVDFFPQRCIVDSEAGGRTTHSEQSAISVFCVSHSGERATQSALFKLPVVWTFAFSPSIGFTEPNCRRQSLRSKKQDADPEILILSVTLSKVAAFNETRGCEFRTARFGSSAFNTDLLFALL